MQTIPQRATDAKFLASIEGYKGNLFKLGRLIRHDWFSVSEVGHKTRDRYLFLFKARILITKVKRIAEDRSIFVLRDIIRLPETSLCGLERPRTLEFHHIEPQNHSNFPITLEARNQDTRDAWLEIVREHVIDTASVDDLLFDDEIRVVSEEFEDQGHISPVAEAEDIIEDLPEDLEAEEQVVPEIKEDIVQEPEQSEELIKQSEDLLPIDQLEEKLLPCNLEQTSKRSLEKEESGEFENTESSPPSKRRASDFKAEEPKSIKEDTPPLQPILQPESVITDQELEDLLQEESVPILESNKELKNLEEQVVPEQEIEIQKVDTEIRYIEIEAPQKESELESFEVDIKLSQDLLKESEPVIPSEQVPEPYIKESIIEEQKSLQEETLETKDISETSTKRPVEEEEEGEKGEDLFDFWGTRESSPPLKKRVASPPVKEVSPQAVSDTKEEDKQFEQVEITAVKAEEPLAEQSEELILDIREDHHKTEAQVKHETFESNFAFQDTSTDISYKGDSLDFVDRHEEEISIKKNSKFYFATEDTKTEWFDNQSKETIVEEFKESSFHTSSVMKSEVVVAESIEKEVEPLERDVSNEKSKQVQIEFSLVQDTEEYDKLLEETFPSPVHERDIDLPIIGEERRETIKNVNTTENLEGQYIEETTDGKTCIRIVDEVEIASMSKNDDQTPESKFLYTQSEEIEKEFAEKETITKDILISTSITEIFSEQIVKVEDSWGGKISSPEFIEEVEIIGELDVAKEKISDRKFTEVISIDKLIEEPPEMKEKAKDTLELIVMPEVQIVKEKDIQWDAKLTTDQSIEKDTESKDTHISTTVTEEQEVETDISSDRVIEVEDIWGGKISPLPKFVKEIEIMRESDIVEKQIPQDKPLDILTGVKFLEEFVDEKPEVDPTIIPAIITEEEKVKADISSEQVMEVENIHDGKKSSSLNIEDDVEIIRALDNDEGKIKQDKVFGVLSDVSFKKEYVETDTEVNDTNIFSSTKMEKEVTEAEVSMEQIIEVVDIWGGETSPHPTAGESDNLQEKISQDEPTDVILGDKFKKVFLEKETELKDTISSTKKTEEQKDVTDNSLEQVINIEDIWGGKTSPPPRFVQEVEIEKVSDSVTENPLEEKLHDILSGDNSEAEFVEKSSDIKIAPSSIMIYEDLIAVADVKEQSVEIEYKMDEKISPPPPPIPSTYMEEIELASESEIVQGKIFLDKSADGLLSDKFSEKFVEKETEFKETLTSTRTTEEQKAEADISLEQVAEVEDIWGGRTSPPPRFVHEVEVTKKSDTAVEKSLEEECSVQDSDVNITPISTMICKDHVAESDIFTEQVIEVKDIWDGKTSPPLKFKITEKLEITSEKILEGNLHEVHSSSELENEFIVKDTEVKDTIISVPVDEEMKTETDIFTEQAIEVENVLDESTFPHSFVEKVEIPKESDNDEKVIPLDKPIEVLSDVEYEKEFVEKETEVKDQNIPISISVEQKVEAENSPEKVEEIEDIWSGKTSPPPRYVQEIESLEEPEFFVDKSLEEIFSDIPSDSALEEEFKKDTKVKDTCISDTEIEESNIETKVSLDQAIEIEDIWGGKTSPLPMLVDDAQITKVLVISEEKIEHDKSLDDLMSVELKEDSADKEIVLKDTVISTTITEQMDDTQISSEQVIEVEDIWGGKISPPLKFIEEVEITNKPFIVEETTSLDRFNNYSDEKATESKDKDIATLVTEEEEIGTKVSKEQVSKVEDLWGGEASTFVEKVEITENTIPIGKKLDILSGDKVKEESFEKEIEVKDIINSTTMTVQEKVEAENYPENALEIEDIWGGKTSPPLRFVQEVEITKETDTVIEKPLEEKLYGVLSGVNLEDEFIEKDFDSKKIYISTSTSEDQVAEEDVFTEQVTEIEDVCGEKICPSTFEKKTEISRDLDTSEQISPQNKSHEEESVEKIEQEFGTKVFKEQFFLKDVEPLVKQDDFDGKLLHDEFQDDHSADKEIEVKDATSFSNVTKKDSVESKVLSEKDIKVDIMLGGEISSFSDIADTETLEFLSVDKLEKEIIEEDSVVNSSSMLKAQLASETDVITEQAMEVEDIRSGKTYSKLLKDEEIEKQSDIYEKTFLQDKALDVLSDVKFKEESVEKQIQHKDPALYSKEGYCVELSSEEVVEVEDFWGGKSSPPPRYVKEVNFPSESDITEESIPQEKHLDLKESEPLLEQGKVCEKIEEDKLFDEQLKVKLEEIFAEKEHEVRDETLSSKITEELVEEKVSSEKVIEVEDIWCGRTSPSPKYLKELKFTGKTDSAEEELQEGKLVDVLLAGVNLDEESFEKNFKIDDIPISNTLNEEKQVREVKASEEVILVEDIWSGEAPSPSGCKDEVEIKREPDFLAEKIPEDEFFDAQFDFELNNESKIKDTFISTFPTEEKEEAEIPSEQAIDVESLWDRLTSSPPVFVEKTEVLRKSDTSEEKLPEDKFFDAKSDFERKDESIEIESKIPTEITEEPIVGEVSLEQETEEDIWGGKTSPTIKFEEDCELKKESDNIENKWQDENLITARSDVELKEEFFDKETEDFEAFIATVKIEEKSTESESGELGKISTDTVIIGDQVKEQKAEECFISEKVIDADDIWGGKTSPTLKSFDEAYFTRVTDIVEEKIQILDPKSDIYLSEESVEKENEIKETLICTNTTEERLVEVESSTEKTIEVEDILGEKASTLGEIEKVTQEHVGRKIPEFLENLTDFIQKEECVEAEMKIKDTLVSSTAIEEGQVETKFSSEQVDEVFDIWGGKTSPPLKFVEEVESLRVSDESDNFKDRVTEDKFLGAQSHVEIEDEPVEKDVVVEDKLFSTTKAEQPVVAEISSEQTVEIDYIWGGKTSPPLKFVEEVESLRESDNFENKIKEDKFIGVQTHTEIDDESVKKEIVLEDKLLSATVTEEQPVGEVLSSEQIFDIEDIWGGKTSPPLTFVEEVESLRESDNFENKITEDKFLGVQSHVGKEDESVKKEIVLEDKLLSTTVTEEQPVGEVLSSEQIFDIEDIWGGKTSPPLKFIEDVEIMSKQDIVGEKGGKDKFPVSQSDDELKEKTISTITIEERHSEDVSTKQGHEDIWDGKKSPPPKSAKEVLSTSEKISEEWPLESYSNVEIKKISSDEGREVIDTITASKNAKIQNIEEFSSEQDSELDDVWGGKTSPPLKFVQHLSFIKESLLSEVKTSFDQSFAPQSEEYIEKETETASEDNFIEEREENQAFFEVSFEQDAELEGNKSKDVKKLKSENIFKENLLESFECEEIEESETPFLGSSNSDLEISSNVYEKSKFFKKGKFHKSKEKVTEDEYTLPSKILKLHVEKRKLLNELDKNEEEKAEVIDTVLSTPDSIPYHYDKRESENSHPQNVLVSEEHEVEITTEPPKDNLQEEIWEDIWEGRTSPPLKQRVEFEQSPKIELMDSEQLPKTELVEYEQLPKIELAESETSSLLDQGDIENIEIRTPSPGRSKLIAFTEEAKKELESALEPESFIPYFTSSIKYDRKIILNISEPDLPPDEIEELEPVYDIWRGRLSPPQPTVKMETIEEASAEVSNEDFKSAEETATLTFYSASQEAISSTPDSKRSLNSSDLKLDDFNGFSDDKKLEYSSSDNLLSVKLNNEDECLANVQETIESTLPAQSEDKPQEITEEKLQILLTDTEKKKDSKKRPSDSKDKEVKRKQSDKTEVEPQVTLPKPQLDEDTLQQKVQKEEPLLTPLKTSHQEEQEIKKIEPTLKEEKEEVKKIKNQETEKLKNRRKISDKKEVEKSEPQKDSNFKKLKTEERVKTETPEIPITENKSESQAIIKKKEEERKEEPKKEFKKEEERKEEPKKEFEKEKEIKEETKKEFKKEKEIKEETKKEFKKEKELKEEPNKKIKKEEEIKEEPKKEFEKEKEIKEETKKEFKKEKELKEEPKKKIKKEEEIKEEPKKEIKKEEERKEPEKKFKKEEERKEEPKKEERRKESLKKKEEKIEKKEDKMAVEPSQASGTGTKPVFTRSLSGDVVEHVFVESLGKALPTTRIEPSDNATFVCEVEHSSQYYVTWLKDNKVLDDKLADRIIQQDEGKKHTLKLLHCKVEDSAIYTAKATDNNGVSATCSAQLLVHKLTPEEREKKLADKKPFFLVKMLPTEVIENTKLSYAIHVKGDPMPKVTFYKDGKTLTEDDRVKIRKDADHGKYEILIIHVQMGDSGTYRCVAMNRFGTAECEAAMTVAEEQKALENLGGKGSLLKPGESADFKWFRDGVEFDPVERFNVMFKDEEDTLALVFQNVTPDDAGIYTCVASTSCGKISCSAELTVEGSVKRLMKDPEPPKFEEELGDNYVAMAGTAMLECKITGYPKPELTWKHNGKEVKVGGRIKQLWEDDENVTLIIKNITEADKGAYSVSAKNELGEASASGKLIIRSPPRFRKIDKLVGCNLGKPMSCVIEVDGEPLPELKWMKDGKEIIPDGHIKFENTPDGKFTMKIDKIGPEDCGNYAIVATNDMGQRAEQFEIQAETPPEITRGLDTETEKKAGNDHTFEVRGHGTPIPEATWYKDGKALPEESDKYKVTRDGQFYMLIIKDVSRRDRGNYKIVLKNRNGTAQSEGSLSVRGPPEFVKHLDDACAKEGAKDIKLTVEWDSNPRPTTKWYFKDKEIHEDTEGYSIKTTEDGSVLTIKLASEAAVGQYSVKLSNEYGDIKDNAKFRLHEPPKIIEGLKDVEFLEDTKCIYKLQVSGVPIPDIRWTKDGKKWTADEERVKTKKEGEEIYMLVFEQAKTEDSGKYSAVISNVEGSVTSEGSIIVNTPPHILRSNFRDGLTFIAMHKFVLEVEATAVPEAVATWYCNGKELKEEEDSVKFSFDGKVYRMERIGSDPEQSGEYKCKLKNKIKEVEEKGTITIIEKESRVRQPLQNVNVKEKTDGKIQCQIVGDPIPTVQWLRNGKPITDDRIVITEDKENRMHYLTFKNVDEEDKSTFTVIGKNQHGECETSCVMTIYVVPRPGELQDTVVDFGRDLLLSVHIHAIPPPQMTWFKNGKQLDESDRVKYIRDEKAEIYSLEIKSVVLEDDATYSYKAKNDVGEASGKALVKIHTEKPTIVTQLQDQEICLEDEVTFKVKVAGLPAPDVEWKNKSVIVNKTERYTTDNPEKEVHIITLKDLVMEDYGTITAIARNLVGEAASTAELKQKKLPCEVIRGLDNVTKGAEGDDVTLSVLIRGSPRPKIVWTKDGDVVEASANFKFSVKKKNYCEATIYLTIVDATPANTGQYRLRFYNELNEATTETALIVQRERRKPNIKNPPNDLSVTEMDPAVVKVKVVGYPKAEVKWLKDGRAVRPTDILNAGIAANNEYVLEFKNVTLEDAGRYTIVATNEEGVTEAEFYLSVEPAPAKPKFIEGLKATNVIAGYPARFEIQLGGHPKPSYAWLKDGKPIDIDGKHIQEIVTDDGRVILQIDNATDADAGEYSVVAKNDLGENTSKAPLSVLDHDRKDDQDGPATFSEGLKDGTFDEGKTIRLPVGVRGGPKVPDMKWFKDGKEVKLGDRVFFTYDGDKSYLEIHPCSGSDSGRYKCVIENPNGQEETECDVTVRKCFESPSFTYTFPNQQKLPGEDAKFSVKVDGVPKPELLWFFNGKPIVPDGEKYRIRKEADGCTLFVKDVSYSDTGAYKVVAKNKEGQSEHSAQLTVADDIDADRKFEAPNILKAIGDQELYEGYTAKFKAVVAGRPEPEFEWYRNGMKLYPSNRILIERDEDGILRLSIRFVCEEDSGIYELKVWNDYGKASCRGKLICECISKQKKRPVGDEYKGYDKVRVSGVPIPLPDKPIISALSNRRCTLSWNPHIPAGPTTPVTYQVEYCECPEGDWITAHTGIRGTSVDISGLNPKSDYKFRVRVENKFGVSEPSPYVNTLRNRLEREPISHEPYIPTGGGSDYIDGPFVPSGFRIDRGPHGNFFAPPRFLKLDHDTQYGMKNFYGHVKWVVFGYPTPKLRFYYKDEEISFGENSKYTYKQEENGETFLFIERLTEDDVGWYKCEAYNEYGESQQRIRLGLSEYPRVLQHLKETYIRAQTSGRIFCRISAYPPCDVKWFKDWQEITPSMKMRPQYLEPDMYCLNFNGLSMKDAGLYSIAAVNVAGAVSSSCSVHVIEDEITYNWLGYARGRHVGINTRRGTLEDHYDIGDELGRGTQGVTYHCVERHTGNNFAAKSMWGKDQFKTWMHLEYDMMNLVNSSKRIVRLYDAYEGPKNMVLVMDLCSGGELLQTLTRRQYITEYEVAHFIRQILEGLDYMHDRWIAHLGLNIGDILLTRPNSTDIKLGDLSLARNIRLNKLQPLEYGMPEYVAPEVVKGENVSYPADMWAVGIIAYILLSGTSPFRGEHDRETLTRIQKGELRFDVEAFANLSEEAKDFVGKLLQYKPENRLDVKSALSHPWMRFAEITPHDPYKISTERLRIYYSKYREWYSNASCRRWYRRRTLASAFTHPSKMVYPPFEVYTPPESPEREVVPAKQDDFSIPMRDLSYEIGLIRNDSRYQQGPDTYLLQLRDTEFPIRLRNYMNLARERSPIAMFTGRDTSYDYERIPIVHERRRFTDIMDEEIEDERRRTMIDKYTSGFIRSKQATCSLDLPKRVKQEITSRYTIREEAEAIKLEDKQKGKLPFIRERPNTTAITPDMTLTLTCVVTGDPEPVVQWFRNDIILGDTPRMAITCKDGRSQLYISQCTEFDVGFYKVVARNCNGQATHRFRLVRGEIPGMSDPPELEKVSGTQVLLKWRTTIEDGGAAIEKYNLQIKPVGEIEWKSVNDSIQQEIYLVENLNPLSAYQFRVASKNIRGWGEFSVSTPAIRTGNKDDPRIEMPVEQGLQQKHPNLQVLQLPGARGEIRDLLDYGREVQNVLMKEGEGAMLQMKKYKMAYEISRGRFSSVMRCIRHDDQRTFACKIFLRREREEAVNREYQIAKSLRHERLAAMYEAYCLPEVTTFIIEFLGGPDILTFLSNKLQYTEQNVSVVVNQVLDAVSYLHWRGICHLDIQPDNVVVTSSNKVDVKLVDFGSAQQVARTGSSVEINGLLDYISPEVMFDKKAYPNSDVWSVGVLTYVLLTGTSPFVGISEEETMANIQCVRFKFETLGELLSQEATRFILLIFKRDPSKRPTEEECKDHKWLGENDFMVRKRERSVLSTTRLREYSTEYHKDRQRQVSASSVLDSFKQEC